ncbi:hypothetical protein NP493_815g02014 [Ridgeia piscesae]|uniref:HTH cro/C1-type domain-containing protein n=1 Tax=Ridgeia piscesae TaxID=27915 RepID=A0AAD9NMV9_RIDPI|nr:hypothetical protein NP493_815g02014 [Ridgeia piscesae]
MAQSGWDERDVTYVTKKRMPKSGQLHTEKALSIAQRQGLELETSKKFAAGQNKQHLTSKNTAKLDRETEELHHDTISMDVARLIQQARQAKGFTQKELATRVNEKQQVINDYEGGRAIPNQQIFAKLERTLGVKLRGKDRGKPLQPKAKK